MRITTFKEQGTKLPIGEVDGGKLVKEFTLRPYKGRVDRHLAVWREANEGKSVAHLAAKYLSLVVAQTGLTPCDLGPDGDSTPEQTFKVGGWYFADAMYMYIYSRIVNVSQWIEIPYRCPRCGAKGYAKADLWTAEVRVIDEVKELNTWVTLTDGFKLIDGKTMVKRLKLQPVRFRGMLLAGQGQADMGALTYAQLRESIVEVEGAAPGYILQDGELDEITKKDLLRIDRQSAQLMAGPDLRTAVDCPGERCGIKIREALNWAFDPFFDSSVPLLELTS